MNIIDSVDFLNRISNLIGHMDGHDQLMCRATLTSILVETITRGESLDYAFKHFVEYVQGYGRENP